MLSEEDRSGSSSCLKAKQTLESTKAHRDQPPVDDSMVKVPVKRS